MTVMLQLTSGCNRVHLFEYAPKRDYMPFVTVATADTTVANTGCDRVHSCEGILITETITMFMTVTAILTNVTVATVATIANVATVVTIAAFKLVRIQTHGVHSFIYAFSAGHLSCVLYYVLCKQVYSSYSIEQLLPTSTGTRRYVTYHYIRSLVPFYM